MYFRIFLHDNPLKKGVFMTSLINLLTESLAKELGNRHFYTIQELQTFGFFGTAYAARKALKDGVLAYVKISPRRRVIPRAALLKYLESNLSEND